jgi:hypothetical protein
MRWTVTQQLDRTELATRQRAIDAEEFRISMLRFADVDPRYVELVASLIEAGQGEFFGPPVDVIQVHPPRCSPWSYEVEHFVAVYKKKKARGRRKLQVVQAKLNKSTRHPV